MAIVGYGECAYCRRPFVKRQTAAQRFCSQSCASIYSNLRRYGAVEQKREIRQWPVTSKL